MELLGRIATVVGISLVLTMLLVALYQDDAAEFAPASVTVSQTAQAAQHGTP